MRGTRQHQPGAVALVVSFLLAGVLFISLLNTSSRRVISITIEERFHLLPTLLFVPFVATGVAWLAQEVALRTKAALLAAVLIPFAWSNRSDVNWGADSFIDRYLGAAVQWAAPDAVAVGTGDTEFFGARWVSQVEHIRPDVHYVDLAVARAGWYRDALQRELPELPITTIAGPPWRFVRDLAGTAYPTYVLRWSSISGKHLHAEPQGFMDRIVPAETAALSPEEVESRLRRATDLIGPQPPHPMDAYNDSIRAAVGDKWNALADLYEATGRHDQADRCRALARTFIPPEWVAR